MAERVSRQLVAEKAIVHPEAAMLPPHVVDRSFEMPTGLYMAVAALFLGFMAVTGIGFATRELILPVGVIVLFIFAFFGVPAVWVRMVPESRRKALTWSRFRMNGIATEDGRVTANQAMVQVLILPVLIFLWGVAVVTIAALV